MSEIEWESSTDHRLTRRLGEKDEDNEGQSDHAVLDVKWGLPVHRLGDVSELKGDRRHQTTERKPTDNSQSNAAMDGLSQLRTDNE